MIVWKGKWFYEDVSITKNGHERYITWKDSIDVSTNCVENLSTSERNQGTDYNLFFKEYECTDKYGKVISSMWECAIGCIYLLVFWPLETLPEFSVAKTVDPPQNRQKSRFPPTSRLSKIFLIWDMSIKYISTTLILISIFEKRYL